MTEYQKSFLLFLIFCILIAGIAAWDLQMAFLQEESKARQQVESTSFLIAEWIKGAFVASDYILRDIVYAVPVSELQFPATNPLEHRRITELIDDKHKTLPHSNGVGLNDENCIVTHTLSIVGFDASQREWCSVPKDNPEIQTYVSNMFTSNNGDLMVIQVRKFPGDEFVGMAGIGVNLNFFSVWLEDIAVGPHGVVAISDQNVSLLARKPANPEALGKKVNDPIVEAFIASGETYKTFRTISPLDDEPRLYGIRKIEGLPFIVLVGEADRDWQANWIQRAWVTISGAVILWVLALITLRNYWARLKNLAELQKARDKLENISLTDSLTGLANRRRFDDFLALECRRMRRNATPISLIMIDLDYFKAFNDTYGHLAGDECLQVVGAAIQSNLKRPYDLAARYGGEEFSCILPETDHAGAVTIAMNIKNSIADLGIRHEASAITDHITASLGVATFICDEAMKPECIVNLADERLYWAKENGRNRVGSEITV